MNSQAWMQVSVSAEGLFLLLQQQLEPGGSSLDRRKKKHEDYQFSISQ